MQPDSPEQRLKAIHSMMSQGQRSVQLECHTLRLYGIGGGLLCIFTEMLITPERFPDFSQRIWAVLIWLAAWWASICYIDYSLTRRARAQRAETLPFAQTQITRAWWMLLGVGVLSTIAILFTGGGNMVYALWMVLLGLGIYLFGLFSRPLIEWVGLANILLGVLSLVASLPYGMTRWLAASCFLLGLPLTGFLLRRINDKTLLSRTGALLLWLLLVLLPPILITHLHEIAIPEGASLKLNNSAASVGSQTVRIPAGETIVLTTTLDSPLLHPAPDTELHLVLDVPLEVSLQDGVPDGRYRIGNSPWHEYREGLVDLRIRAFKPVLHGSRMVIRTESSLHFTGNTQEAR